jgi:hypothetical protein
MTAHRSTSGSLARLVLLGAASWSLLACGERHAVPGGDASPVRLRRTHYFPPLEKDVDLLFVIDNSNLGVAHLQENLANQFPLFIEGLRSAKLGGAGCSVTAVNNCRIPNLHIGVVSSDMGAGNYSLPSCEVQGGDGGKLQVTPRVAGCIPPKDPWTSYTAQGDTAVTNIPGGSTDPVQPVKDAFSCIAQLGTGGCGFEHHLESARDALDPRLKVNPGFLRDSAFLAIVILGDEDDCSAQKTQLFDPSQQGLTDPLGPLTSFRCTEFGIHCDQDGRQPGERHNCVPGFDWLYKVEDYYTFFSGLKPPGRVIMFAIGGPVEPFVVGQEGQNPMLKPSCQSADGSAVPDVRIASLVSMFGRGRGYFNAGVDTAGRPVDVNICSHDYSPAMRLLGEVIIATLGGQCISAPPITANGGIACDAGHDLGSGVTCATSCLDRIDCVIQEALAGDANPVEVPKCPAELFAATPTVKDCGASCPMEGKCWRIIPDAQCDPAKNGSPYALQIMRAGGKEPDQGRDIVDCAISLAKWGSADFSALPQCN